MMALKKVTVCALTENKEDVEIVRRWIEKWKPEFQHFKNTGCGCCIVMYDVLAPSIVIDELLENLSAWSEWSRPESFDKKR